MSECTLLQERMMTRFELRLEGDAIAVTEQDGTLKRAYRVPLESLAAAPVEVTVWSKGKLWSSIILFGLSALVLILYAQGGDVERDAGLFWAMCGAIAVALFIRSRQTYVVIHGDPSLVLMKDRPTAQAVGLFLERVLERKRAYLSETYLLGTHESALVDAIHKLDALREAGSISAREYEVLKGNILRRAEEARPPESSRN
jgi:hypothetical protein